MYKRIQQVTDGVHVVHVCHILIHLLQELIQLHCQICHTSWPISIKTLQERTYQMAKEQKLLFSLHQRVNLLPHKSEDGDQTEHINIHSALALHIWSAIGFEYGLDYTWPSLHFFTFSVCFLQISHMNVINLRNISNHFTVACKYLSEILINLEDAQTHTLNLIQAC